MTGGFLSEEEADAQRQAEAAKWAGALRGESVPVLLERIADLERICRTARDQVVALSLCQMSVEAAIENAAYIDKAVPFVGKNRPSGCSKPRDD